MWWAVHYIVFFDYLCSSNTLQPKQHTWTTDNALTLTEKGKRIVELNYMLLSVNCMFEYYSVLRTFIFNISIDICWSFTSAVLQHLLPEGNNSFKKNLSCITIDLTGKGIKNKCNVDSSSRRLLSYTYVKLHTLWKAWCGGASTVHTHEEEQ